MMLKSLSVFCLLLLSAIGTAAQDTLPKHYASPAVLNMPGGKGLVFFYEGLTDFFIKSRSGSTFPGDQRREVQVNNRQSLRLHLPLLNKARLKAVLGIKHYVESYEFEKEQPLDYPLYYNLDRKNLVSTGLSLNLMYSLSNQRNYILVRGSGDLNGDYRIDDLPKSRFIKYSLALFYGWKKSEKTSLAFGLAYSYDLGIPTFYPALVCNHTFNRRWGIESVLPKVVKLRYNVSPQMHFYWTSEVEGASYHLRLDSRPLDRYEELELRWSELRSFISMERQIGWWLWMSLSAGWRYNLQFNLSENNAARNNFLIRSRLNQAFFMNASLFLVPSKDFGKKGR